MRFVDRNGETLREAVTRRLGEELGVEPEALAMALPDFAYRAEMADGTVEHELCPVVVALVEADPLPDPREVAEVAWVPWDDLVTRATLAPRSLSPWSVEQLAQLSALAPSLPAWLSAPGRDAALDEPIELPARTRLAAVPAPRPPQAALAPTGAPLTHLLDRFLSDVTAELRQLMVDTRLRARAWTREHGEDMPEVRDWVWPA